MGYVDPTQQEAFPAVDAAHAALSQAGGSFETAAGILGIDLRTLYRMAMDFPEIHESAHYYRRIYLDTMVDRAERKLMDKIDEGNFPAIAFALKSQGRKRGWQSDAQVITDAQAVTVQTISYADAASLAVDEDS